KERYAVAYVLDGGTNINEIGLCSFVRRRRDLTGPIRAFSVMFDFVRSLVNRQQYGTGGAHDCVRDLRSHPSRLCTVLYRRWCDGLALQPAAVAVLGAHGFLPDWDRFGLREVLRCF